MAWCWCVLCAGTGASGAVGRGSGGQPAWLWRRGDPDTLRLTIRRSHSGVNLRTAHNKHREITRMTITEHIYIHTIIFNRARPFLTVKLRPENLPKSLGKSRPICPILYSRVIMINKYKTLMLLITCYSTDITPLTS